MGFKPISKRKKYEDTIVGQTVNSIAAFKARQNIYIQNNHTLSIKRTTLRNKMLSLYSARNEAELFNH